MSITLLIVITSSILSFLAFNNLELLNRLIFWPYEVKRTKEYHRFITSGFIHGGWAHLIINMFVLWSFGSSVEAAFQGLFGISGRFLYLVMYLVAIIISDLPSYFKHKDNVYYRSLGASGAVSAVLFAAIALDPGMTIMFIFPPIPLNAVVFGLLYLVYSAYMERRGIDNIGHSAHLFGALFGFGFMFLLKPALFPRFLESVVNMLPFV